MILALLMSGIVAVTDGDTLTMRLRLHGIDAPEQAQQCQTRDHTCYPCGELATQAMKALTQGTVTCASTGQVSYGRPVVACTANGRDLGEQLVTLGHARAYGPTYARYEGLARAARRGIWQGPHVPPAAWRKGERLCPRR